MAPASNIPPVQAEAIDLAWAATMFGTTLVLQGWWFSLLLAGRPPEPERRMARRA